MTSYSREVLPSARRLIGSLRDIGYSLSSALADLVDNSISAGATLVQIDMRFEGAGSWMRIADNGRGMTWRQLEEALRFGSRRDYEPNELGRYGLGLKLATLSQCRLMTVASRTAVRGKVAIRQWDLDHVEETDRWEILRPTSQEVERFMTEPLEVGSGTVVMLEDLDRVLRYANPDGSRAEHNFDQALSEVQDHLSMVFHRFLSGEARSHKRLTVLLNGMPLSAWDPFCRGEPATRELPSTTLSLRDAESRGAVKVHPYILPNEAAFSSHEAHNQAGGPKRWNGQQGLYVYRNDRLIQSGGWARLRTADEHTKLARVAVEFSSSLDDRFGLNIAKSQVRLPRSLRDELAQVIAAVAQLAQREYRAGVIPSAGSNQSRGQSRDPRAKVLQELVALVVAGCEAALRDELGSESLAVRRAMRCLRSMEQRFATELEELITGSPLTTAKRSVTTSTEGDPPTYLDGRGVKSVISPSGARASIVR
jgi:hypothetical protein